MFEAELEELGLTRNEAKVYLALLQLGPTTTGPLIQRTGLHGPRVYECLERLIGKGLVSFVLKNKRKYFEAADPERLMDLLKEKEKKFAETLPKLKAMKIAEERKEVATIYQGKRGLRTLLDFILSETRNGEYLDFGVSGIFRDVMGPYWDVWQATKRKWKIRSKCIFEEKIRGSKLRRDYFGEARFVHSKYHCPSDTFIFGDFIAVFMWTADPPTAVLIKDAKTAQGYKNIFKWMWKSANR